MDRGNYSDKATERDRIDRRNSYTSARGRSSFVGDGEYTGVARLQEADERIGENLAKYCSKYPAKPEWEDTPKEDLTEYELKSQGSER